MNDNQNKPTISLLHGIVSAIIPGGGQFIAGKRTRGIAVLFSLLILGWLSIWTVAQRARFPDLQLSASLYLNIYLQTLGLIIFMLAVARLATRVTPGDISTRAILNSVFVIILLVLLVYLQDRILSLAGDEESLSQIFGGTAIFSAAGLAALYVWNIFDALKVGTRPVDLPSFGLGLLFICLVILTLGWRITKIDLPKAIAEYEDTSIILPRILWPWEAAFEYEKIAIESEAKVIAPCPPGTTGPEVQEPVPGEAWVSVTPTCGDLSVRELATGDVTFGTELTISGGGFQPRATVELYWRNPIGNAFQPRGVGETDIRIDGNGEFTTQLFIPEVAIPSTAVGDQVHTVLVRQESGVIFTGNLSEDIELALVGMLETIMIGLMATFFGVVLAFPFSFFAARNLMEPIQTLLAGVVGGVIGLVPAFWLGGKVVSWATDALGGLEQAPIQIALISLVVYLALSMIGWRLGSALLNWLAKTVSPILARVLAAVGAGGIFGLLGYALGTGFARGVVSIPLAGAVSEALEIRYAWGGAVLIGLAALIYTYVKALDDFGVGMVVYAIARTVMNIIRSIEPLIWAIIAVIWIGLGPFAGTIALTLHTIAALGKLYSEAIESIDAGPIEALQATGANRLQTIIYAVVPQILPPYISFTIYRWDINVRMSTIIGAVGGGGIGFILIQWIRLSRWDSAGLAVWLITITVATLDYISSNIRERYV